MIREQQQNSSGSFESPGGFVFGVQGWTWGEPRPRSITFFLDNTALVADQHGRPIKGTVVDGKEVYFAQSAPSSDDPPGVRSKYATHEKVIEALAIERIDWQTLSCAGWPQLPYTKLKELQRIPPTPSEELHKIKDPTLRKAALRMRREVDEATRNEEREQEEEELDEATEE